MDPPTLQGTQHENRRRADLTGGDVTSPTVDRIAGETLRPLDPSNQLGFPRSPGRGGTHLRLSRLENGESGQEKL